MQEYGVGHSGKGIAPHEGRGRQRQCESIPSAEFRGGFVGPEGWSFHDQCPYSEDGGHQNGPPSGKCQNIGLGFSGENGHEPKRKEGGDGQQYGSRSQHQREYTLAGP